MEWAALKWQILYSIVFSKLSKIYQLEG